jgi:hypothetical protein
MVSYAVSRAAAPPAWLTGLGGGVGIDQAQISGAHLLRLVARAGQPGGLLFGGTGAVAVESHLPRGQGGKGHRTVGMS